MLCRAICSMHGSALRLRMLALAMLLALGAWQAAIAPASAQIQLQIGGDEAEFHARLSRSGYDQIKTIKIGLSSSVFEACKGDRRYRIRFEWTGATNEQVIGTCRPSLDVAGIIRLLERSGYYRVAAELRGDRYIATACRGNDRFEVNLSHFGDILSERRTGRCQSEPEPAEIIAALERQGYDRVEIVGRNRGFVIVQACRDRSRLEIEIDRTGRIASQRVIGECRGMISAGEIVSLLERQGFTRVQIIDENRLAFRAQACRGADRFEVTLDRWGTIRNQVRTGTCPLPYTAEQIREAMEENGYTQISIREERGIFVARGCSGGRMQEVRLDRFGTLIDRRDVGACQAPRLDELADMMARRGMRDIVFAIEGCRNGRRLRVEMDRLGNRLDEKVLGGC